MKTKTYLFWGLMLCSVMMPLQNIKGQINVKVIYSVFEEADSVKHLGSTQRMCLLLGNGTSHFFNENELKRDNLKDSLFRKGYSLYDVSTACKVYPIGIKPYHIYKNYPSNGTLTFTATILTYSYKYSEPMERPRWKILEQKKKILGYDCQKAQCLFRGIQWDVWFTPDLPFQDGPWKLWGLPGCILQASDAKNYHVFTCIGVESDAKTTALKTPQKHYLNCSRKQYLETEKLVIEDPQEYYSRVMGVKDMGIRQDGSKIHYHLHYLPIEIE